MRRAIGFALAAGLSLAGGCEWVKNAVRPAAPRGPAGPVAPKPAEELVAYLNRQEALVTSLQYRRATLVATVNGDTTTLGASSLVAEKPRNIAVSGGKGLVGRVVQIGSNDDEFWMYLNPPAQQPVLVYCPRQDFARAADKLPVPFDPDWAMQALGLTPYPAGRDYTATVQERDREHHLSYTTTTPQNRPVKVTVVFAADDQAGLRNNTAPQVRRLLVSDPGGRPIAVADITHVSRETVRDATGVERIACVPARVKLSWPDQKAVMELDLGDAVVNGDLDPEQRRNLFTRRDMGVEPRNLALVAQYLPRGRGTARAATPGEPPASRSRDR